MRINLSAELRWIEEREREKEEEAEEKWIRKGLYGMWRIDTIVYLLQFHSLSDQSHLQNDSCLLNFIPPSSISSHFSRLFSLTKTTSKRHRKSKKRLSKHFEITFSFRLIPFFSMRRSGNKNWKCKEATRESSFLNF